MSSNEDWKKWGELDPYFGVVTHAEFRKERLSDASLAKFFDSGQEHVEHVLSILGSRLQYTSRPSIAIDYGCGTGRVVVPLSAHADKVLGLDISDGMLREARKNADIRGIGNAQFRIVGDDDLLNVPETADFIHSHIVFQHIPMQRGERIFRALLRRLGPGGAGAVQFTLQSRMHPLYRAVSVLRNRVPFVHQLLNVLQRKKFNEPRMRMEAYSFPRLLEILHEFGVDSYYCERTDHGGHVGVIIYFVRPVN